MSKKLWYRADFGASHVRQPQLGMGSFAWGNRIDRWDARNIVVYPEPFKVVDCNYLIGTLTPIVSTRFKEVVESVTSDDVQFFPIRFQADDGSHEVPGYHLAANFRLVNCLDTSVKGEWVGSRFRCYRIQLRSDVNICASVFEIAESPGVYVVSSVLRDQLLQSGVVGCGFDLLPMS